MIVKYIFWDWNPEIARGYEVAVVTCDEWPMNTVVEFPVACLTLL